MQGADRHFPSLEMLLVLLPPGCDRLTFGRDLYHGSLLLPPNLLLLLLSVAKEAGYSHSQLLQSVMSQICRLGFIPGGFAAPHKVQVWSWQLQPWPGLLGTGLGLFMPWRGSCHQNCQLSSDCDKASAEGNVREREQVRKASAKGLEQWAQGERQAGLSHTSQCIMSRAFSCSWGSQHHIPSWLDQLSVSPRAAMITISGPVECVVPR